MTTGAKHQVLTEISMAIKGDEERRFYADCRCMKGTDHDASPLMLSQFDPDEDEVDEVGEPLSASDAADIWRSRGEDEDYMFGYSEDELRRAADED
jgi:hypothetical protein